MVSLYRQAKRGMVDPPLLGRLVHLLSVLAGVIRDTDFEQRLAALEAAARDDPNWPAVATNGAGRDARH